MRTIKIILGLLFCLSTGQDVMAHQVISDWKLSKESDQIEISYRYLNIGDTLKTRQMRITFMVETEPNQLVSMFRNAEILKKWTARAEKCEMVEQDHNSWTIYNLYDIPWPFQQKDLITEYRLVEKDSSIELFLVGRPMKLPQVEDVSRMGYYEGHWSFEVQENGHTKVEFTSITFQKPQFPKFIQDPIIHNTFIDSINNLKQILEEQGLSTQLACETHKMEESK